MISALHKTSLSPRLPSFLICAVQPAGSRLLTAKDLAVQNRTICPWMIKKILNLAVTALATSGFFLMLGKPRNALSFQPPTFCPVSLIDHPNGGPRCVPVCLPPCPALSHESVKCQTFLPPSNINPVMVHLCLQFREGGDHWYP